MLHRFISLAQAPAERVSKDGDLVVKVAFSSELPYERWWGVEILDHGEGSIRLARLNDGAPLLYNHDWDDLRGVHVQNTVAVEEDKVLRGKVRITSATQDGRDTIGLVETGVLNKASIGYQIYKVIEQTTSKDGKKIERTLDGRMFEKCVREHGDGGDLKAFQRALDAAAGAIDRKEDEPTIYRVVDWEPLENSLVTVPADPTVGVGRAAERTSREKTMDPITQAPAAGDNPVAIAEALEKVKTMSAQELEAGRVRAIDNLCKANKLDQRLRDAWVQQGYSIEQVSEDILRILEERGKNRPAPASRLGLTDDEVQQFSFLRAIRAVADKDWSKAGFEADCSKTIAQKLGRTAEPNKFYVPFDVMEQRKYDPMQLLMLRLQMGLPVNQRDLTVATAGAGGFLVSTDNVGFIEMLRNRSVAFRMGVRRLSGLQGNVTIPRQSAAATAFWLATEATTITESQQTFVQLALTPKTVSAYTEISRLLLLQSSPGAEGIVTDDLAQVVALAADLAVLEGSGAGGQPTGIANTAGIGAVTGTSLAAAGVIEFQTDVAASNVTPMRGGYVTTAAVAGLLMVRPELPSTGTTRLWQGNVWDGSLFGFPAMTSNQLTAASMIFGDWQEAVVGEWGVLEVEVNPFANFAAGIIGVRAMYSLDVGVRRPFAFSRATSIT